MTKTVTNIACRRVRETLDAGLAEGVFRLAPEQMAHAARCPICGPQVKDTERLLARLRSAGAAVDVGPAMRVVDQVLAQTGTGTLRNASGVQTVAPPVETPAAVQPPQVVRSRRVRTGWVLGQVAVVAAALLIAVSTLAFVAMKVERAVAGADSGTVVEQLTAPFRNWADAWVKGGQ